MAPVATVKVDPWRENHVSDKVYKFNEKVLNHMNILFNFLLLNVFSEKYDKKQELLNQNRKCNKIFIEDSVMRSFKKQTVTRRIYF